MAIYQFLIAIRAGGPNQAAMQLTNAEGETTSHIQGLFNRTIRFMSEGIRPAFVFDGKPPQFKSGELKKRREKRKKAEAELKVAIEENNTEAQEKQQKRLVVAGKKENEDSQKLLQLMGVPVIMAPCEAEAQAASMCKAGKVYAVGTEDMDALTFATPVLLRKMTFANASKSDIQVMDYKKAVEGLGLTHDQFVDLCILLGCDYCDSIGGVGPKTALKLIREHKCIEEILKNIGDKKYRVPDSWIPNEKRMEEKAKQKKEKEEELYDTDDEKEGKVKKADDEDQDDEEEDNLVPVYVEARKLFNDHEVETDLELKWKPCQAEELTKFLVDQMGFNPERVKASIEKLQKAYKATSKPQLRMDSFFKAKAAPNAATVAAKRKAAKQTAKGSNKKTKGKRR
uniref:Flap endonuclease 1 n=1 Tax=Leptocylindrus danicus TaxID=163516 RepID=A0A7S2PHZ2_9STRA